MTKRVKVDEETAAVLLEVEKSLDVLASVGVLPLVEPRKRGRGRPVNDPTLTTRVRLKLAADPAKSVEEAARESIKSVVDDPAAAYHQNLRRESRDSHRRRVGEAITVLMQSLPKLKGEDRRDVDRLLRTLLHKPE